MSYGLYVTTTYGRVHISEYSFTDHPVLLALNTFMC